MADNLGLDERFRRWQRAQVLVNGRKPSHKGSWLMMLMPLWLGLFVLMLMVLCGISW